MAMVPTEISTSRLLLESRSESPVPPSNAAPSLNSEGAALGLLAWLLPLVFLHGLLYLFVVPPWQHYDEPTHFEKAALVVQLGRQPDNDDVNLNLRREIADSMYRNRFWEQGLQPDLLSPQPPDIGVDQTVHPPLYYSLVALPLHFFSSNSIEVQLFVARGVSVCLYVLTIFVAWRISAVLAPDDRFIQIVVPLLLCLTPAFADMMTAVNNDVLVNFSLSIALLGCIYLIRDGVRPTHLLLALLGLLVALFTKRTAVIAIIPVCLALLWALHQQPMRWWTWIGGLFILSLFSSFLAFRYDVVMMDDGPHPLLRPRGWLITFDNAYLRLNIDATIQSLTDVRRSLSVYPDLLSVGFRSFWQDFGWGQVTMGIIWEQALLTLIAGSFIGLIFQAIRNHKITPVWQKRCIWLFLLMVVLAWVALVIRIHPLPPPGTPFYVPRGRYMHVALLPTLWLIVLGVKGWFNAYWQRFALIALVIGFIVLDTTAWSLTIVNFYYR